MKYSRLSTVLVLLMPLALLAQTKNPAEVEPDLPLRGASIPIPDNGYNGSLASMACRTINQVGEGTVVDASIDVAIDHTWVGDLTIKLISPGLSAATVLSRPGLAESADDGTDCCGDSSNLELASPITFSTTDGTVDAETMGGTIDTSEVICTDDGECLFTPNSDSASDSGDLSAIFSGESPAGDWQLCVGDSGGGDVGNLGDVSLNLVVLGTPPTLPESTPVPTLGKIGLFVLMLIMGGLGLVLMRRRQQA